jgi:YHS domain-containing protein
MKHNLSNFLPLALVASVLLMAPTPVRADDAADKAKIEELKKTYPLQTCPVSGEKLGSMDEPVDYLYKSTVDGKEQVRLVQFCCKSCTKDFNKEPAKYLAKIDEAAKAK